MGLRTRITGLLAVLFCLVLTLAVTANAAEHDKENASHPVPMGSQDCLECHLDATPDISQQWQQSAHGFAMVKCQICHGDANNFAGIPTNENCRSCHPAQYANNVAESGTACATCHPAHSFTVHKGHQYQ